MKTRRVAHKVIRKKYIHRVPTITPVSDCKEPFNIHVVYFLNGMMNDNYMDWLINQMNFIKHWKMKLYIVVTLYENTNKIKTLYPTAEVTCTTKNQFEYSGIRKVWDISQTCSTSQDLIFYFHSKGITHTDNYAPHAKEGYNNLFELPRILEVFGTFPTVDKVGYSCSKLGFVWYNFWVARGSYLCTVEKPIITIRRHYYEDWLCRVPKKQLSKDSQKNETNYYLTPFSCYSLNPDIPLNIGYFFDEIKNKYRKILI
jgi:hypothetical protein